MIELDGKGKFKGRKRLEEKEKKGEGAGKWSVTGFRRYIYISTLAIYTNMVIMLDKRRKKNIITIIIVIIKLNWTNNTYYNVDHKNLDYENKKVKGKFSLCKFDVYIKKNTRYWFICMVSNKYNLGD